MRPKSSAEARECGLRLKTTKKIHRTILLSGVVLTVLSAALFGLAVSGQDPLAGTRPGFQPSIRVEDRHGRLLREFLSAGDTRSQWAGLASFSPHLVQAALAAEDQRFFSHPGIDPLAVCRAFWLNLKSGRVRSGASTITMQLARMLEPGPRTLGRKILEARRALMIEWRHSKEEILEEYLNRVPCGNLTYGIPAAAELYLGKSPAVLSPAEAAFLMSLPKAPTALNPYRNEAAALARRNQVLSRMARLGFISSGQAARAKAEPLGVTREASRFRAPHFVTHIKNLLPSPPPSLVRTTLDLELQTQVENLVSRTMETNKDKDISQAAVLVMDHRTREILAWVGSADFFDLRDGQNDGVLSLRQPGSTVKPFTYAAAFDAGLTPSDMIEDSPVSYRLRSGIFSPANYDRRFHGEISLRAALASSLNVPAVKVMDKVGLVEVYGKMKAAGLKSLDKEPDYYGLGLTLGCGEVTLLELANAYATLAAGGVYKPPVLFGQGSGLAEEPGVQVFSPQAAALVTDILSDDAARATGFGRDSLLSLPFPAAAKTGTSKNFRDNWTVGYTSSLVVAVWAGNFDARPMGRVSGISGAGPLWRQVMRLAASRYEPREFPRPDGLTELDVCPDSGLLAGPDCPGRRTELFIRGSEPDAYCLRHLRTRQAELPRQQPSRLTIINPRPGERYLFDPGIEKEFQNLALEALAPPGVDSLVWLVNGNEIDRVPVSPENAPRLFWPLSQGRQTFTVIACSNGREVARDRVAVEIN